MYALTAAGVSGLQVLALAVADLMGNYCDRTHSIASMRQVGFEFRGWRWHRNREPGVAGCQPRNCRPLSACDFNQRSVPEAG